MRQKLATVVAWSYWLSVVGTFAAAAVIHDEFGFSFIPFMFLSLPWSLLAFAAALIPNYALGVALWAVLCWVLSGFNALVLYSLIAGGPGALQILKKAVRRWGQRNRAASEDNGPS